MPGCQVIPSPRCNESTTDDSQRAPTSGSRAGKGPAPQGSNQRGITVNSSRRRNSRKTFKPGVEPLEDRQLFSGIPNTWATVAPLPLGCTDLAATTGPDGRIYAISGINPPIGNCSNITSEVNVYNVSTNTWAQVAPLPTGREGLAATTGPDGRIYAIGGVNGNYTSEVDAYNVSTNTWTQVTSLPNARKFGGYNGSRWQNLRNRRCWV